LGEVFYNIFIGFGTSMKVVQEIEMCLNETYNKAHTGKYFSDAFSV
jgi:hypothetical protein